jgi:YfiH family protein
MVFARQMHGTKILRLIGLGVDGVGADSSRRLVGDALVTNVPNTFLSVQTADCQSILLYDPSNRVAANVHSGWRGSIRNIVGQTVAVMRREFRSRPTDIIAGVGPSLGPCCAEFVHYRTEIPREFWKYKDDSDHFDFWAISRDQLGEAGVSPERITLSQVCTKCNQDHFFSFRGEGVTGRFASVIGVADR